jgi:hypothetical protein
MTFVPKPLPFRVVSLEMSLKPFHDSSPETRETVCRTLFRQWLPLCRSAREVHVMLWIADGSEILDYRGDLDATFEWARYVGGVNRWHLANEGTDAAIGEDGDRQGIGMHGDARDPEGVGLHRRCYLYRDEPAVFTYSWLRDLVSDLKRIGSETTGLPILVGETFDPGPEFAKSPFKYERHREICTGGALYGRTFVGCATTLNGDGVSYAGFPGGIPDQTPLGTFLGRQVRSLFDDMGFDFLWLSNGFGFGLETWGLNGALFDGYGYAPSKAAETADSIRSFWRSFRHECPDLLVRTRGTNLTSGVDLASDAVPLRDIYRDFGPVQVPVNSPWAALDGDFGLELAGWMSHIAEHTEQGIPFRFYTHDPWWMNSPWLDRYERRPHDIYLPLSVGCIDGEGRVEIPDTLAFLTVDDSRGGMPEQVPADVTSHILRARENPPDAPGPVVWVYPFDEYHDLVFGSEPDLPLVNFGDWYVRGLINQGVPVNTVVSTSSFISSHAAQPDLYRQSVLLCAVPTPGTLLRDALLNHLKRGNDVILYGPIDREDNDLLGRLGIGPAPDATGDLALTVEGQSAVLPLHHAPVLSAGPLNLAMANAQADCIAAVTSGGRSYPVAMLHTTETGGRLGWLRGTVTCDETHMGGPLPAPLPPNRVFPAESLGTVVLARMGWHTGSKREGDCRPPLHTIHRASNALVFSGFNPDRADDISLSTPMGAPVFTGHRCRLAGGNAHYVLPEWWHAECRVYVTTKTDSRVACKELPSIAHDVSRRLLITGLRDASLRFYPEAGTYSVVRFLLNPSFPYLTGCFAHPAWSAADQCFSIENLDGDMLISW